MILILAASAISFLVTFFLTPGFARFLERSGLVGRDVHKSGKRVPEMGGPPVIAGFLSGTLFFVWASVFVFGTREFTQLFAGITTILIITIIGILDDIGSRYGLKKVGLRQWQKPLLTLPAAVPLMAIMAGDTSITVPFLGTVDVGLLYPLVLVPLAVIFCSNVVNMLGGFNGLEAGMGFVIFTFTGIYGILTGNTIVSLLSLVAASSLLAFLFFNWYPARIFPGDSLSYSIGVTAAVIAVLGGIEKVMVISFSLYFIEFFIKARNRFATECFGRVVRGRLVPPERIGSVTHLYMRFGLGERGLVLAILGTQALISLLAILA